MEEEMSDDATDEVEQQGSFMTQEEEVAGGEGMSRLRPGKEITKTQEEGADSGQSTIMGAGRGPRWSGSARRGI